MPTNLRSMLLDSDKDIWEIIDFYKAGNELDGVYELLKNQYDPKYERLRYRALFILDELPYSVNVDWESVLPHIIKADFRGDFHFLSRTSSFALNIIWGRIPRDNYVHKAFCIKSIDYYDEVLFEYLLIYLFCELKSDPDFFKNVLHIYIKEKFSCEHGIGISLLLNKDVKEIFLKEILDYGDPVIEFYATLYICFYRADNLELINMLGDYKIKGVSLKDLYKYEYNASSGKFYKLKNKQ